MKKLQLRITALILSLLMLLPMGAFAQDDWQSLQIIVSWNDGSGEQSVLAEPILWSDEQAFWAQVPGEALDTVSISATHPEHPDETVIQVSGSVTDAGSTLDASAAIILQGGEEMYVLYISTQPMPEEDIGVEPDEVPDEEPVQEPVEEQTEPEEEPEAEEAYVPATVQVPVICRDEDGRELRSSAVEVTEYEPQTVAAPAIQGYTLAGDSEITVTVDHAGEAEPDTVIFVYSRDIVSAQVTVTCVDTDGNELYSDDMDIDRGTAQSVEAPELEGYTLQGEETVTVRVDENGVATPDGVTFVYARRLMSDTFTVKCLDLDGGELSVSEMTVTGDEPVTVTAPAIDGYVLQSEDTVVVTLDEDGASEDPVLFLYAVYQPVTADV